MTGVVPQLSSGMLRTTVASKHMVIIDQVIDWMLLNPGAAVYKASKQNGGPLELTPTWIRQVASSDAFKARLREKQQEMDAAILVPTLKERLEAVATQALERMEQMVHVATDPEFIRDSTEMLLEQHYKLGIPAGGNGQGQTTINIDARTVAIVESRKRILEGSVVPPALDAKDPDDLASRAAPLDAEVVAKPLTHP